MFSRLPSVGPKTAERYVFFLLQQNSETLQKFAQAVAELKEKIVICRHCLAVAEASPCAICSDGKRDRTILALTANTRDLMALEATGQYQGRYLVLGGLINTIEGIEPDQLNIKQLTARIKTGTVREVIFALSPTLEGETTTLYLARLLKPYELKLTRLARGMPSGATLEYADEMTLVNALKMRNEL